MHAAWRAPERLPEPAGAPRPEQADGACRHCGEHGRRADRELERADRAERHVAALTAKLKEVTAELAVLRSDFGSGGEAKVLVQLAAIREAARSRGKGEASLYVPELAQLAGVGERTVSRAFAQLRLCQADPAVAESLPLAVKKLTESTKTHLRLIVKAPERGRLEALKALARLPRAEGRKRPGGRRCPMHPDAPVVRSTSWHCTVEGCTWMAQVTGRTGGRRPRDVAGTSVAQRRPVRQDGGQK
jgi:hypothetical protein